MEQRTTRHLALFLGTLFLAATLAACSGSSAAAPAARAAAPAAAPADAPVDAAAPAAQAIAMADDPQLITPQQYEEQFASDAAGHQLIDVRTAEEFASGHIAGAVNIPVEELSQRIGEVSMESPVVLYCRSGRRSAQAAQILDGAGYAGVYDLGGIQAWQAAGLPVEK